MEVTFFVFQVLETSDKTKNDFRAILGDDVPAFVHIGNYINNTDDEDICFTVSTDYHSGPLYTAVVDKNIDCAKICEELGFGYCYWVSNATIDECKYNNKYCWNGTDYDDMSKAMTKTLIRVKAKDYKGTPDKIVHRSMQEINGYDYSSYTEFVYYEN